MYQYFSKKDALLHAVLQQHLSEIGAAVEASVPRYREQPLAVIADGIVGDYLNVKIANIDISRALYRILPDLDAPALQAVLATKIEAALYELLASAADVTFQDLKNIISVLRILLVSMVRTAVEEGASRSKMALLRSELATMTFAYLRASIFVS